MKNLLWNTKVLADEKGRNFHFDNSKFLLIFFVVLAHLFGDLRVSDVVAVSIFSTGLWSYFNTFHMAAFIFISGYFAKNFMKKGFSIQKPATYFFIYLAAQVVFIICEKYIWSSPDKVVWTIFKAQGSLWFMQCMVIWYLLIPMLDQFKPKYIIPGAIILGLIVGYDIRVNDYLSFSRVIVHLPFFMAGYYTDAKLIEKLKKKKLIAISWVVLIAVFVIDILIGKKMPTNLLRCNTPYYYCGFDILPRPLWWVGRLAFYAVVFLLIASFLAVVPNFKTFFSKWGSRTLAVYLLHRLFFRSYEALGWYKYFNGSIWGMVAVFFISLALVILLSLKPFSIPFDYLQKISIKKALKDK
ncbi:MAG: heparan-alpha-glucosaminide N-acetyltransferase domain-containing protein [Oscillospiraceae bacterium]|nr:heparan-alpha-glucosaminide N-acetyltransferase domain-containing protein [Oscillospiraceae bacterium]